MKTSEFRKLIREEVRKTLSDGAILTAIRPRLEGDVKVAVQNLEKELASAGVNLNKYADVLADCIIDIIDAAKQEERIELSQY